MSEERFDWLGQVGGRPGRHHAHAGLREQRQGDLRRVRRARRDPANVIFNQFCEFGTTSCTARAPAPALERTFVPRAAPGTGPRLRWPPSSRHRVGRHASAPATTSRSHGARIVAVEALECPTMLYNGFGEHNIQGIGDKHIPLIHNVTNTDVVGGDLRPGDRRTQRLSSTPTHGRARAGRARRRAEATIAGARHMGSRRSATCWPRSRRPSVLDLGRRRRGDHGRHRRRRVVRSEHEALPAEGRYGNTFGDSPRPQRRSPEHLDGADVAHTSRSSARSAGTASSTSATSRGSSSRASTSRRSRRGGHQSFWDGLSRSCRAGTS
jgi:hypothetical protein